MLRQFLLIRAKVLCFRTSGTHFHKLVAVASTNRRKISTFTETAQGVFSPTIPSRNIHTTKFQCKDEHSTSDNDNKSNENSVNSVVVFAAAIGSVLLAYLYISHKGAWPAKTFTVTLKEFVEEILPTGEVVQVYINSDKGAHSAYVQLRRGTKFRGQPVAWISVNGFRSPEVFHSVVRNAEKNMGIDPNDNVLISDINLVSPLLLVTLLISLTFLALGISFALRRMSIRVVKNAKSMHKINQLFTQVPIENIPTGIKFADVAGCAEAKQEVMEFVHYLKNPEKYERLGAKMPRGCLLTGPPGVGKTLLAKAVATESEVPFLSKAGSDFVELIGGLGAKRVRNLFSEARDKAPCIVYIDELDAVGTTRSASESSMPTGSSERDQTLNQILVEMDGMLSSEHNVIVMASTNRVDMLDKALLRPGRFDRHIMIDLPTKIERKEIFERHLKNLKLRRPASSYSLRLANLSPGMSGADIASVCNEAAICAARDKDTLIDSQHFEQAFERILAGSKKKSSSLSPDERNIVAVHEAGHALVGWMLKHTDAPIKVSIVPRTKATLGFTRTLPREHRLFTRSQLKDRMTMMLAGRAAENLVFGSVTHGAEDDLKKATDLAYSQVKYLGLSPIIGHVSFPRDEESYVRPYSDALANKMDNEVKKMVFEAHKDAQDLLERYKSNLDILAKELISKETLNYNEIEKLIGPPPHGGKIQVNDLDIGSFAPTAV